ncbi:hypothetical protein AHAS_Ahas05G0249600 [Arachis hypogaea]
MENFGLESIEGKTISLQKTAQQEFKADCLNLVGKVITNKELAFKTIQNTLIGVWENPEGISISEVDKNKVSQFQEQDERVTNIKRRALEC